MKPPCILHRLAPSLLILAVMASITAAAQPESPVPGESKYLLLDSRLVAASEGVRLVLGKVEKDAHNPLFGEDKPWEARFDNLYANVCYDDEARLFKCWYSPFIIDGPTSQTTDAQKKTTTYCEALKLYGRREMGVCYAVSQDGIVWQKPDLGIVEFEGSRQNNLVLREVHGSGVFKDLHETDPARRYKMLCMLDRMAVAFSPDGLHWSEPVKCPQIDAAGDTHNNALWDATSGRYVGLTRLWRDGQRVVGRTVSDDFLRWTKAEEVLRGLDPHAQVYAMPMFRYANVYLGLAMIFDTHTDLVDCELAWSPDTIHWERVCPGTPLIPRGPEGSCDWGCIYAATYPILRDGKLLLYYSGSDGPHTNWRKGSLCLARLRPDGFAALEPSRPDQPGQVTTRPVRCLGKQLCLTADAAGGSLRAILLDADGKELKRSRPLTSDGTDVPLAWEDGADLTSLVGQPICLRVELDKAKLYAFGFAEP
jgi:hypothetical protein